MKLKFKALFSVLMAVLMLSAPMTAAFAQEETALASEETTELVLTAEPESDENETVATVSLCSCIYVWPISGHTWIYVQNNSDEPITVGHYEVPVGQGVSVGAFSFSVRDGWGIYYNIEAYKENIRGRIDDMWSKSKELNASELEELTDALVNYPNAWTFGMNCATFAFSIWNSVSGDHFVSLLIPAISQFMIMVSGGQKGVLEMYCPEREQILRQKGTGSDAYLVIASDGTIS